ncbi:MAG: hypothetical protein IJ587_10380, partial [Synergistaceae bacterium]|nr:hypothetical protein [Synergistaceae bacterium]
SLIYSEGIIFGTASKSTGGLLDVALVPISLAGALLGVEDKPAGSVKFIHVGDRLRYVTPEEAKDLVKKKAFATKRPKEAPKPKYSSEVQEAMNYLDGDTQQKAPANTVSSSSLENYSIDPEKVIPTYGLQEGEAKSRIALHNSLMREVRRNPKSKNAYDRYVSMAQTYTGDYLAAYQAGLIAKARGNNNYALYWFKKSLEANPNFEPARNARDNIDLSPAPAKKRNTKKRR